MNINFCCLAIHKLCSSSSSCTCFSLGTCVNLCYVEYAVLPVKNREVEFKPKKNAVEDKMINVGWAPETF